MIGGLVFTIAGAILLILYVREKIKAFSVKALILKALVSCCFLGVGFSALLADPLNTFGIFILIGLFLGLMGDIWLDLKLVYPSDDTPYTFAGFIFFAVGHVAYILGLLIHYYDFSNKMPLILAIVLSTVAGIAVVLSGPIMKLNYGKFKLISMIYAPLLIGTTLVSLSICIQSGFAFKEIIVMFVGGILFLLSDLVLSGSYFGEGKNRPVDFILNYAFYYGAQFVIAWVVYIS